MATTTTSKPIVILRKKSPNSIASSQPVTATRQPQKSSPVAPPKGEAKAKVAPQKQAPQKPKAEAKKPTPPPTPRPADGMNARQRRNRKIHQAFLQSPEFAAISAVMVERWPHIFRVMPDTIRPLAIGIKHELILALPQDKPLHIAEALRVWINDHRVLYWNTLMKGDPRYNLNGEPKGEVTPEEQEVARQQKEAWIGKGAEIRKMRVEAEQGATKP